MVKGAWDDNMIVQRGISAGCTRLGTMVVIQYRGAEAIDHWKPPLSVVSRTDQEHQEQEGKFWTGGKWWQIMVHLTT